MSASTLLLKAYLQDGINLGGDEQHLVGLANRMRLFAPKTVIDEAESVMRGLIEISLEPRMDLRQFAVDQLSRKEGADLLLPFSVACRADLDQLYMTVH